MSSAITEHLKKILRKIKKKYPETFKAINNKIREVVNSEDIEHYKPLTHSMKNMKRVHISKSFVLVFEYDRQEDFLKFIDYDHHDVIYKKY